MRTNKNLFIPLLIAMQFRFYHRDFKLLAEWKEILQKISSGGVAKTMSDN
jgi:hypothetical protein